jgi:glycosyltransferase involved in cell wall biosynthesis
MATAELEPRLASPGTGGRPRLLLLITLAGTGGAQTYVASLLPHLTQSFDVTVAAHGTGPLADATAKAGARYVELTRLRRGIDPVQDLRALVEIVRLLRRERPHIVHSNSSKAGIIGRLAAPIARVPISIFTVHGWAHTAHQGFTATCYFAAERLVCPLTTYTICVAENERVAGLRARTCRPGRTAVIRNAVDVVAARQARPEGDPPTIVSVGRLIWPKDFLTLVRALARLEPGSFRALFVGGGPEHDLVETEIRRLGLEDSVQLLGERDDVPSLLAAADLFVLSTKSEAMPMSILEAMAAGLPVVAARVGGVPELIVEGETGLLVPPGDVEALAEALGRLVGQPELRCRYGHAARKRAEERFDLPDFHRAHVELYGTLLAERELPLPIP